MALVDAFAAVVHSPAFELLVYWDTLTGTDETAYVVSASGQESMDDLGLPHPRQVTITLDNASGRFTPEYTGSALYAWTTHVGQRATVKAGYDGELTLIGTYIVRDLTTNDDDQTATLTLSDVLADYGELAVSMTPTGNLALATAATTLLRNAGLGTALYNVGSLSGTAVYAYANSSKLLDELWQVAVAEGGRFYLDEYGVVQVQSAATRKAILQSPVATLRASQVAYKATSERGGDQTNRVVIAFEDRITATSPEVVFSISSPLEVPASYYITTAELKPQYQPHPAACPDGEDKNGVHYACGQSVPGDPLPGSPIYDTDGTYIGNVPGNPQDAYTLVQMFVPGELYFRIKHEDFTRWKSNIAVDISTATFDLTANTAANGSGTAITLSALAEPAPNASAGTVVEWYYAGLGTAVLDRRDTATDKTIAFWNRRSTKSYITQLDMNAKPTRREATFEVFASDADAIARNGGRVVERRIVNSYLINVVQAQQRARDLLWTITASRESAGLPDVDGVPFLRPGDPFTLINDGGRVERTLTLQVLENRWTYSPSDGYRASLVTIPALDVGALAISDDIPPPVASVEVTAERTGPFRWATSGTALYWSQGSWG